MAKEKKHIPVPILEFTATNSGFLILIIGIILALVVGGLANIYGWVTTWMFWLLAIGVIVGILNIFHEEGVLFLISGLTITFMLNLLAGLTLLPEWALTLVNAVISLLVPATLVVALKVLYALATKELR